MVRQNAQDMRGEDVIWCRVVSASPQPWPRDHATALNENWDIIKLQFRDFLILPPTKVSRHNKLTRFPISDLTRQCRMQPRLNEFN
jgi:hypothetical protein